MASLGLAEELWPVGDWWPDYELAEKLWLVWDLLKSCAR